MTRPVSHPRWGNSPWSIDFQPAAASLPAEADFAIIGGGFSGLSAAAWLRRFAPDKSVVLFESAAIGAGSSGHTGGMVLAETAAGDLPGLGDVLAGFTSILKELAVECDLALPGVYEIGRSGGLPDSPISWSDSGVVRAVKQVPGGMIDPGKMVSGLARAAEKSGAQIFENEPVEKIEFEDPVRLHFSGGQLRARKVLVATNGMSLELSDLAGRGQTKFTLAVATEPLDCRPNSRAWGWLPKGHSTQSIFRTCGGEFCARAASSSEAASSTWMIGANSKIWMSTRANPPNSSPGWNPVSARCTRHCKM